MLFKQTPHINLMVYQDQRMVRAFELDKRKWQFFLLAIFSLVLLGLLGSSFLLMRLKNTQELVELQSPQVIAANQAKRAALESELLDLKALNLEYREKMLAQYTDTKTLLPFLALPAGHQNLMPQKWPKIEAIDIKFSPRQVLFHFNIVNDRQDGKKLRGYIIIVMNSGHHLAFYPKSSILFDRSVTAFHQGETFVISRFRKVEGVFNDSLEEGSKASFKIFIFSRTGDILHYQGVGPMEVVRS